MTERLTQTPVPLKTGNTPARRRGAESRVCAAQLSRGLALLSVESIAQPTG